LSIPFHLVKKRRAPRDQDHDLDERILSLQKDLARLEEEERMCLARFHRFEELALARYGTKWQLLEVSAETFAEILDSPLQRFLDWAYP
jgi:hypothetical protein